MKTIRIMLPLLGALLMTGLPGNAAEVKAKPVATKSVPVARVLKSTRMLTGKPSLKAQIYIYMQTATWCGPCRMAMPKITAEYEAMKKDGRAELILINYDQDPVDGKSYVEAQMADMVSLHMTSPALKKLPGFTPARTIPDVTIVSAGGKVLLHGGHEVVAKWREYVK